MPLTLNPWTVNGYYHFNKMIVRHYKIRSVNIVTDCNSIYKIVLTLAGGYGLEGSNLLFNFTAFTFRTLKFFLLIFRNFHDHGKRLLTFFTNKFVCWHGIISFYL